MRSNPLSKVLKNFTDDADVQCLDVYDASKVSLFVARHSRARLGAADCLLREPCCFFRVRLFFRSIGWPCDFDGENQTSKNATNCKFTANLTHKLPPVPQAFVRDAHWASRMRKVLRAWKTADGQSLLVNDCEEEQTRDGPGAKKTAQRASLQRSGVRPPLPRPSSASSSTSTSSSNRSFLATSGRGQHAPTPSEPSKKRVADSKTTSFDRFMRFSNAKNRSQLSMDWPRLLQIDSTSCCDAQGNVFPLASRPCTAAAADVEPPDTQPATAAVAVHKVTSPFVSSEATSRVANGLLTRGRRASKG